MITFLQSRKPLVFGRDDSKRPFQTLSGTGPELFVPKADQAESGRKPDWDRNRNNINFGSLVVKKIQKFIKAGNWTLKNITLIILIPVLSERCWPNWIGTES